MWYRRQFWRYGSASFLYLLPLERSFPFPVLRFTVFHRCVDVTEKGKAWATMRRKATCPAMERGAVEVASDNNSQARYFDGGLLFFWRGEEEEHQCQG